MGERTIRPGTRLLARDAFGKDLEKVAMAAPEAGGDFAVVWVCWPDQWPGAERPEDGIPWPLDDVRIPAKGERGLRNAKEMREALRARQEGED